jgi:hypothetical protein
MSTSNLRITAANLQRSIQRTLSGAKPRHLTKRFRQLLSSHGGFITILTPIERDGKRTVRVESVRGNRLAVAGAAVERARQATLTDEVRQAAGLKERGSITGRHRVVAKVLCWLVLAVGLLGQVGCLDNLTTDVASAEGPCETFPSMDGGLVTVCAIKDPHK